VGPEREGRKEGRKRKKKEKEEKDKTTKRRGVVRLGGRPGGAGESRLALDFGVA
jgi:hypothetical protein